MNAKDNEIFHIPSNRFDAVALETFQYQSLNTPIYREFIHLLGVDPDEIKKVRDIPYLPIQFFKSKKVIADNCSTDIVFSSSGTTGQITSKHHVHSKELYEQSFTKAFELFYGQPDDYIILALLPSYLERGGSSLVYMADHLIKASNNSSSGFYLNNIDELASTLTSLDQSGKKVLLLGVSYALLDLIEKQTFELSNTIVMETGGMKGRRKELVKEELHKILKAGFGVTQIHSEYGMTELLSQAYSSGEGIYHCPPWMKVLTRDPYDPFDLVAEGQSGGINVIDLANRYSCSFIATQDLGKVHSDNSFEILGRFDHSDIRGCNLMAD